MQTVTYTAGKDGFEAQVSYQPFPDFNSLRASVQIGQSVVQPVRSFKKSRVTPSVIQNTLAYDQETSESKEVFTFGAIDRPDDLSIKMPRFHRNDPPLAPRRPGRPNRVLTKPITAPLQRKVSPTRVTNPIKKKRPSTSRRPNFRTSSRPRTKPNSRKRPNQFSRPRPKPAKRLPKPQPLKQEIPTGRKAPSVTEASLNQLYRDLKYPAELISRLPVTFDPASSSESFTSSGTKSDKKYFIMDRESVLLRLQAIVHGQDVELTGNTKG